MLEIFLYIYFPRIISNLAGIIQIIKSPLTTMLIKYQKLLTNRNLSETIDVPSGCYVWKVSHLLSRALWKLQSVLTVINFDAFS